ncbi:MAG TPA: HAMP domain-containing sensor histidine kinase [Gammaproteobacteria bacterium]
MIDLQKKHPLKNRIVFAFTLQTLFVTLVTFSAIVFYVDHIEESVLYQHFDEFLDVYVEELEMGTEHIVPTDTHIYQTGQSSMPDFVRDLPVGAHNIELADRKAYHVLKKDYAGREFVLVKDQSDLESTENYFNFITLMVFASIILTSFVFSRSLARRIVLPIVNLTAQVRQLTPTNYRDVILDYADDEVGGLVKVVYQHIHTVNQYLQREQWFTGDISHELRTPLMVISSSVELLKQNGVSGEQREQLFQRIDGALENINEMISAFLILARNRQNEAAGNVETDLAELCYSVIDSLKPSFSGKDIDIHIHADSTIKSMLNSVLLSIVVSNLLKNAIANMRKGRIDIYIEQNSLVVEDNGSGLPEVVENFVNQGGVAIKRANASYLGLGLSIIKRICEREGWSIHAASSESGGARFTLNF